MTEENKTIDVDFNPSGKMTSAEARKRGKEICERINKDYREKRYLDKPGPDCPTDEELLSLVKIHPRFYWTEKNQKIEKHWLSCRRCNSRLYYLIDNQ